MRKDYSVKLAAKNEGVDYRDGHEIYHFNVLHKGRQWTLFLPPSKGDDYRPHELTREEEERILPRIIGDLSRIRWFGLFPFSYRVVVEREPPFSIEEHLRQMEQEGWIRETRADGLVVYNPPKLSIRARMRIVVQVLRAIVGR